MEFISVFFVMISIIMILYLIYLFHTSKRLPIIFELFSLGVYVFVAIIFLFPSTLKIIEKVFGIQSAINFIVYFSIFVAYFWIFLLYKEKEQHREDISRLTREIAFLKGNKDNKSKK